MAPTTRTIPVIDFSQDKSVVADRVLEACSTIGFFYMINHNLPQEQIDRAFALSKEYFDLPSEEKRKHLIQEHNHGYSELYSETLDPEHQRQGDHKEGFNFRNFVNGKPFAPLPKLFADNEEFIQSFSRACHATAMTVLEAFARALAIPESEGGIEWFTNRHHYDEPSGEILRFLKYPHGGEAGYQDTVRAGAHSDYGSITLLFQKDVPGLEVQANREEWISAPLIDGSILVNVGDQMQEWSGGLFKSTLHRVTFLPEHNHVDRYSMPFFVHPEDATPLVPIPSALVPSCDIQKDDDGNVLTAGGHLLRRLQATYSYEKA
ncbi:hypothetical protein BCR42DRAFT_406612 [Absidia repens]|uniref:Fe2OG dioxygenase domain-containing protein n=1 Tax=Absidia repens TaxID=90262 RepID=A0A1X2IV24_9FUNG|nr:hypothetical protein BCR42DRAFT_406612 [Absidia repens]